MSLVKVETLMNNYLLIKPSYSPPRPHIVIDDINSFLNKFSLNEINFIDFETTGLPLTISKDISTQVISIACANDSGVFYHHFSSFEDYKKLIYYLKDNNIKLSAYNVMFDGLWPLRDFNIWLNWVTCVYAIHKLLATEGFFNQKFDLKFAQKNILLWEKSCDEELQEVLASLNKKHIHEAPRDVLAKYCALDAESTYLLYKLFIKIINNFYFLKEYIYEWYPIYLKILANQAMSGILVDKNKLIINKEYLENQINQHLLLFYNQPLISTYLKSKKDRFLQDLLLKTPNKETKSKKLSKVYLKWEEKYNKYLNTPAHEFFSYLSVIDKTELIYDVIFKAHNINYKINNNLLIFYFNNKKYEIPLTEKNHSLPIDKKIFNIFEELKPLSKVFLLEKEKQFFESLEYSLDKNNIYHPLFKVPGTLTGRLAGSNKSKNSRAINIQQIPKSSLFLELFIPSSSDNIFCSVDLTSLEQVVLAELSRDKALLDIYNSSKPNDVYLYVASKLPKLKDNVLKYYNPTNLTETSIEEAKKMCKFERNVAKVITLGCSYNMGVKKLYQTLILNNINASEEDAKLFYDTYWLTFEGVKQYHDKLLKEYNANGGWILNGLGRPITVDKKFTNDLVNRVIQSTGHDIFIKLLLLINQILSINNINFVFKVADFHDETIFEIPKTQINKVENLIKTVVFPQLNEWLDGLISLRGSIVFGENLAKIKGV